MKLEYSLVLLANVLFLTTYATDRCVFFSGGWLQDSGACELLSIPRFGQLEVEPITLIEGIESMQSPDDFVRFIGGGYQYETEGPHDLYGNKFGTEKTSYRREYSIIYVVVADYEHLCCRGELSAIFLNEMLQRVEFYPENDSEYLDHLRENYDIDVTGGAYEQGYLMVSRAIQMNGFMPVSWAGYIRSSPREDESRFVVVWEDSRFEGWRDLWLQRFGQWE